MIINVDSCREQAGGETAKSHVVLVGEDALSAPLQRHLGNFPGIPVQQYSSLGALQDVPDGANIQLVVALSSHWRPAYDEALQRWCQRHACALLRVSIWQREAVIGPLVLPGTAGCVACAEWRRRRALVNDGPNEQLFFDWCSEEANLAARAANPWLTVSTLNAIAALAAREIQRFLAGEAQPLMVRFVQLRSLVNSCHTFLPNPMCPLCGQPEEDSKEGAKIRLLPRPRSHPQAYRLRSLEKELGELEKTHIDNRLGIQLESASFVHSDVTRFASATSGFHESSPVSQSIYCGGYTPNFRASRATAIVEALERYSGSLPRGKRTTVYGSYRQLQAHALDPASYGLYSPEQYDYYRQHYRPNFCVPYHPDLKISWVWGYSLRQARPVLVPEQLAYFYLPDSRSKDPRFVVTTSSGCAVGGSLEEAMLYSLFELIERDAFLIAWYGRLKLPRLDIQSTADKSLRLAVERIERVNNFTLHAFDCTTEFGLPAVLCVGVNHLDEAPKIIYGASAHWLPDRAVAGACYEVAIGILGNQLYTPQERERAKQMVTDYSRISTIADHVLTGSRPEAFAWADFLFQDQPLQALSERFAAQYAAPPSTDLTQDLASLSERVLARGYDVVVVDQTVPELRRSNLHCARVLVPGLLPLAFGYNFQRLYGLDRVYRMPKELGYTEHELTAADLNPYPHAFP